MVTMKYSITNNGIINKLPTGSDQFHKFTLGKYWQTVDADLDFLSDQIYKGLGWMPGVLEGANRANSNVKYLEILGTDVDEGLTIEQAKENSFIKEFCARAIESASSTNEQNKFRLIWVLPERIEPDLAKFICIEIMETLGVGDPACKDAARFFYGAKGKKPFLSNDSVRLPIWLINKAKNKKAEEEKRLAEEAKRLEEYKALKGSLYDEASLAMECLEELDPSKMGWYDWRDCLLAAHHAGVSEGEAYRWSASSSKHTKAGFYDVWNHIKDNWSKNLTVGSLVYKMKLAKAEKEITKPVLTREPVQEVAESKEVSTITMDKDQKKNLTKEEKRQLRLQALRQDVNLYLQITDPLERLDAQRELLQTYQINGRAFEEYIKKVLRDSQTFKPEKTRYSMKELLELETGGTKYLVNNWVPRKTSILLSGLPGDGKTLLAIDMAYSICNNMPFLEEKVKKGKVLAVIVDQDITATQRYMIQREFSSEDDIDVWNYWHATEDGLKELEEACDKNQYDLVILDSVRSTICYPLDIDESKDPRVGERIARVNSIVNKYGTTVWIHHNKKDPLAQGVSKASGNTAIPANVSYHWVIESGSREFPTKKKLSVVKTRGGVDLKSVFIDLDTTLNTYKFEGQLGEDLDKTSEVKSVSDRIVHLLKTEYDLGEWVEGSEIKEKLGTDSVYMTLNRMSGKQLDMRPILGKKRGKAYRLVIDEDFDPIVTVCTQTEEIGINNPPPLVDRMLVNLEMSESQSEQELQTTNINKHLTNNNKHVSSFPENISDVSNQDVDSQPISELFELTNITCEEKGGGCFDENVSYSDDVTVCTQIVEVEQFSYAEFCLDRIPQAELVKLQNNPQISLDGSGVVREVLSDSYMLDFGSGLVEVKKDYMQPASEL